MKTTDYNSLAAEIDTYLTTHADALPWSDIVPQSVIAAYVLSVYLHNDISKAIGLDYVDPNTEIPVSFIVSGRRVVSIVDHRRSWLLSPDTAVCLYDDVLQDVDCIVRLMATAYLLAVSQ